MSFNTVIATEQLAQHPEFRVFDCRHDLAAPQAGANAYAQGHIPGALHANMDTDLSSAKTGRNGRHPLPELATFVQWLGRCGVRPTDQIVTYDGGDGAFAARLWWMLRAAGHEAVAVLDGGLAAWRAEGRPEATDVPGFAASEYPARESTWPTSRRVTVDEVEHNLQSPAFTVIDARANNRYQGNGETIDPVGGHIPGALNRPFSQNTEAGRFKAPQALRAEFDALLADRAPTDIVHQCGSGVTACHNLLAMEVAGLSGSRLYAGSWSEWCSDPSRPVATGA
ncbi:sulfurtransferase [soil metagenome]